MSDQTILPMGQRVPVVHVAVDLSLPHLDRPFDYLIPSPLQDRVAVGVRVKVHFGGRRTTGLVVGFGESESADLRPLDGVVSAQPVATEETVALMRRVASHQAGTFADVARLAIPPRHARTEATVLPAMNQPRPVTAELMARHRWGSGLCEVLASGRNPRAAWSVAPTSGHEGDWARGFAECAAATAVSGRRSLLLAPTQEDVERLSAAVAQWCGPGCHVVLSAEQGPAERYRAFLSAIRGRAPIVVGARAAVWAPLPGLGLVAMWDEAHETWSDPRAPYPHARTVACLRAASAGLVLAGHARSAETALMVESGWLEPVSLSPAERRRACAVARVAVDSDQVKERDPRAGQQRLPSRVFDTMRAALASGPVLVVVPRAGYVEAVACQGCRERGQCSACGGPLHRAEADGALSCRRCRRPVEVWSCPACGDHRWRAIRVGALRTAEELAAAFADTPSLTVTGDSGVDRVGPEPRVVVATPGAEPSADGGFSAAIILDADAQLARPDLRVREESLRRWWRCLSLVRPAEQGGTALLVGEASSATVQAWVRIDPEGAAARELEDRREAGFPPAAKLVSVTGESEDIQRAVATVVPPTQVEMWGPLPVDKERSRMVLTAPHSGAAELLELVVAMTCARSAAREGAWQVRVDPPSL